MTKRALVVGSQTGGLEGPILDAQRMAGLLEELGFEIDLRIDAATASRAGIIEGYRHLIEHTQKDDAALFYFSGHGVRVLPSSGAGAPAAWSGPRPIHAIVPMDFELSSEDDFRGIADVELSAYQAELTRRTDNATVILDCCHAATMSRGDVRPKALPHASHIDLEQHLARVISSGLPIELLAATGNPRAVRLVAAGPSQSAYERPVGGVVVGTFTESLLLALGDAKGRRVTWEAILQRVRERVLAIHEGQRADVEGPRRRYAFTSEEAPRAGTFAIVPGKLPRDATLRAGRVHGVRDGDEYAVLPNGAAVDVTRRIATATVTRVEVGEAAAELRFVPPHTELSAGAQAVQLTSAGPRRLIRLEAEAPAREAIAKAIEGTKRFTVIGPEEPAQAVLATVRLREGQLELVNGGGSSVVPPMRISEDNLVLLATNLRMLAAAQGLRELGSEGGQLPEAALEVSWGRVEAGEPIELQPAGELLSVGARIFIRLKNTHPQKKKLYVSVFDIGLAQRIQLITNAWPGGIEIGPGESFVLGRSADGRLKGFGLGWSKELPEDEIRTETLVVIAMERPCDLAALETPGALKDWSARTTRAARGSSLQQLVSQIQYGGTREVLRRDLLSEDPDDESFLVRQISFELSPWPLRAAVPGQGFLIDERPPGSIQVFAPRGAPQARARRLAVRLTSVIVHDTRALFGSSDIRIDTLVTTGSSRSSRSSKSGEPPYRAETLRFKDVRDGEELPLDNALVFHGEARDFLDLRVWVSRDRDRSKALSELLDEQLNSHEFQEATAALLTAAAVASAAPVVAAIGAGATLTAIAWRLLSAALPKSIGLYQTSLLAGEGAGFGQGRHPPRGRLRAQGFSFGYEVVAVG